MITDSFLNFDSSNFLLQSIAKVGKFYQFGQNLGYKLYGEGEAVPSAEPSAMPSLRPTGIKAVTSLRPTVVSRQKVFPSSTPTRQPSNQPSDQPTNKPSMQPTSSPTGRPTNQPSDLPKTRTAFSSLKYYSCEGYWPPSEKPLCPSIRSADITDHFNLFPAKEIGKSSPIGSHPSDMRIGRAVNGIEFHTWNSSYYSKITSLTTDWKALSPETDFYAMDECRGLAGEVYHHNSYPKCLANKLHDKGKKHSPIYGFAFDGYPIYGPYHNENTLSVSCWQKRDYKSSETGCADGKRSCKLRNQFDVNEGVDYLSTPGPEFNLTLRSSTGAYFEARNGIFFEDYFYNSTCAALGNQYLNEYNGHSHDGLGFHYHTTIDISGLPTFPYIVGPNFYGCILSRENSMCDKSDGVKPWHSRCLSDDSVTHTQVDNLLVDDSSIIDYSLIPVIFLLVVTLLVGGWCGVHLKSAFFDEAKDFEVIEEGDDEALSSDIPTIELETIYLEASHVTPIHHSNSQNNIQNDNVSDNRSEKSSMYEFMAVGSLETAAALERQKEEALALANAPSQVDVTVAVAVAVENVASQPQRVNNAIPHLDRVVEAPRGLR